MNTNQSLDRKNRKTRSPVPTKDRSNPIPPKNKHSQVSTSLQSTTAPLWLPGPKSADTTRTNSRGIAPLAMAAQIEERRHLQVVLEEKLAAMAMAAQLEESRHRQVKLAEYSR